LAIIVSVFFGFLVVGLALPVLPLHVHNSLGMSPFTVGLVTGSQFIAALATRMWAGRHADTRGAKHAVMVGLLTASASGLLYLGSTAVIETPSLSVAILLLGRAMLGGGESFLITGALGWGVAVAGPQRTGQVMAWVGTAMYAAYAFGAPVGTALHGRYGFASIAMATAAIPLATMFLVAWLPAVPVATRVKASFLAVLRSVWVPGVALALSSIGFGAITAFVALLFADRGWQLGWTAITAFAGAFMLARLALGHKVDAWGGPRIAFFSLFVEAAGLLLIWHTDTAALAIVGAGLTGLGYSLIYPGLGVEAVRRAPPESRALAMGAYTACLDLALGFGTPALGVLAGRAGFSMVFLASASLVLCALPIAWRLANARPLAA
jgi:MFS family permease